MLDIWGNNSKVLPAQRHNFLLIFFLLLGVQIIFQKKKKTSSWKFSFCVLNYCGSNETLWRPLYQSFPGSIAADHLQSQQQEHVEMVWGKY